MLVSDNCVQRAQDKVLLSTPRSGSFLETLKYDSEPKFQWKGPRILKKTIIKVQIFYNPSLGLSRVWESSTGKASVWSSKWCEGSSLPDRLVFGFLLFFMMGSQSLNSYHWLPRSLSHSCLFLHYRSSSSRALVFSQSIFSLEFLPIM